MPNIMKKLLQTDTPTVNISILRVVCLPVIVKNLRITTMKPITYDKSFCKKGIPVITVIILFLNKRTITG